MAANFSAYKGNGDYVFVSYSHKDREHVYPIICTLNDLGYNIWYDEGIPLMADYGENLYRRIKNCRIFMLFVSKNSVASSDVNKEVLNAFSLNKQVVRINIDDSALPDSWTYHLLPSAQYISVNENGPTFYSKLCDTIAMCRGENLADFECSSVPDYNTLQNLAPLPQIPSSATAAQNRKSHLSASRLAGLAITTAICVIIAACAVFGSIAAINYYQRLQQPSETQPLEEPQIPEEPSLEEQRLEDAAIPKTDEDRKLTNIYKFKKVDDGFSLSAYSGTDNRVVLPNEYNDEKVVSIGDNAFEDSDNITLLAVSDKVTSIGSHAFSDCSELTSLTMHNSVLEIGSFAFSDCSKLGEMTLPRNLSVISEGMFYRCERLTKVSMPISVKTIDASAFAFCTRLSAINIPNDVETIGSEAFANCTALKKLTMPNSVTHIGNKAFDGCRIEITAPHEASYYGYTPDVGVTWIVRP